MDKMVQTEQKIEQLVKSQKEVIMTPVTCFVTFETQEGFDRCEYWLFNKTREGKKNKHFIETKLQGHKAAVASANEPTDIIWENLQFTKMFMRKCQCKVFVIILLVVICIFLLFTALKSTAGKNKTKYPQSINCSVLTASYTTDQLRHFAELDKEATLA